MFGRHLFFFPVKNYLSFKPETFPQQDPFFYKIIKLCKRNIRNLNFRT